MAPTIEDIQNTLNRLYWSDPERYMEHLNMVKGLGYRIFRNSKGQHKVQVDMSTAFGGIFNQIFNGGNE